jgi:hypothetical protein
MELCAKALEWRSFYAIRWSAFNVENVVSGLEMRVLGRKPSFLETVEGQGLELFAGLAVNRCHTCQFRIAN